MTAQDWLQKVDKHLDDFETQIGLLPYQPNNDVHRYIKMSQNELKKLTPEETGEASFLLRRFAFHLQQSYNRELTKVNLLDKRIKQSICSKATSFKAPSLEERRDLAIQSNEQAKEFQRLRDYYQARADRIIFLARGVSEMAQSLEYLSKVKKVA